MPTFVTTSRDIARAFRTAWLADRLINGDIFGQGLSKARVLSVQRDPFSIAGSWRVDLEAAASDSSPTLQLGPSLDKSLAASGTSP